MINSQIELLVLRRELASSSRGIRIGIKHNSNADPIVAQPLNPTLGALKVVDSTAYDLDRKVRQAHAIQKRPNEQFVICSLDE